MGLAQRTGAVRLRTSPRDAALREARACYGHMDGERGVRRLRGLAERGWMNDPASLVLTPPGRAALCDLGIDVPAPERGRRPLCRTCLDWSERRSHLSGALGAAILDHVLAHRWARRGEGRMVRFNPVGARGFNGTFGFDETRAG